jgi:hypothetical protein
MNQQHLEKNPIGSMRQFGKSPQRIATYFNHRSIAYAKAEEILLVSLTSKPI